jgi:uncharacterized protein
MKKSVIFLFIIFISFSCIKIKFAEKDVFSPKKEIKINAVFAFKQFFIRKNDSISLEAWYMSKPNAKGNIIFFHGNGGNLNNVIPFFNMIGDSLDANIFAVTYSGYGQSDGNPTIQGIIDDGDAAFNYFKSNLDNKLPVYAIGYSLGGFAVLNIATRHKVDGVVTISAFSSSRDLMDYLKKKEAPFFLRPFLKLVVDEKVFRLDNISLSKQIQIPALFIHGEKDDFIPPFMCKKLYDSCSVPNKKQVYIQGADHVTIMHDSRYLKLVVKEIREFALPK